MAGRRGQGQGRVELRAADRALERGDTASDCGPLGDFLNHVATQTGKKISVEQAEQLYVTVTERKEDLGC